MIVRILFILPLMALHQVYGEVSSSGRQLETYGQYESTTSVMDRAAVDLDLRTIGARLSLRTPKGNSEARAVYTDGAYSKSYAKLKLNSPLNFDLAKGEEVSGLNAERSPIKGSVMVDAKKGDSEILIKYSVSSYDDTKFGCFVGGNPSPVTWGCFANIGSINVGEFTLSYTYGRMDNNLNDRSLQKFSQTSKDDLYLCDDRCPYKTYKKFYDYYGSYNYADDWVMAAFSKTRTNFDRGNADFSIYKEDGPAVAIKNGITYLNVWMHVIGRMERAIDRCLVNDDETMKSWDGAVAYYTGILYDSPSGEGYLLHTLAKKQCKIYGTCSNGVNDRVYSQFNLGRSYLLTRQCTEAEAVVAKITQLMTIPMVQGMLKDAYSMDHYKDTRELTEASGATYAAVVLPLIHNCKPYAADQIYQDMRVGNGGTGSYEVIKHAIERQYDCLGITCQDVGGIVDITNVGDPANLFNDGYRKNAGPCGISSPSGPTGSTTTRPGPTGSTSIRPGPTGSTTIRPGNSSPNSMGENKNSTVISIPVVLATFIMIVILALFVCVVSVVCWKSPAPAQNTSGDANVAGDEVDGGIAAVIT